MFLNVATMDTTVLNAGLTMVHPLGGLVRMNLQMTSALGQICTFWKDGRREGKVAHFWVIKTGASVSRVSKSGENSGCTFLPLFWYLLCIVYICCFIVFWAWMDT